MAIDYGSKRRLKNFKVRKVRESLPEYFTSENPTLVTFLEKYYEFLDSSEGTHAFGDDARQIFATKDVREMPTALLNPMTTEVSGGLKSADIFNNAKYALTRIAELTKLKGSRFGMEEFFRLFFQQKAEVEYGKQSMFLIGDSASQIGVESLKFIQNDEIYQTFGLLIKTGISVNNWNELYKKYAHPAGFYYAGQVISDAEALNPITAPLSIADSADTTVISQAINPMLTLFTQPTTLVESDGILVRQSNFNEQLSDYDNTISLDLLDKTYHTITQLITPNSFTFDDSSIRDSDENASPDFSLLIETMDNDLFTTSDSAI